MARKARPLHGHPYHEKTDDELRYILKDAREARDAMRGHSVEAELKYQDQMNDAATVLYYRNGMPRKHRFEVGQTVWAKSGKRYTIARLRSDGHPKLKGEWGYDVRCERDGAPFGPVRLMRESSFCGE